MTNYKRLNDLDREEISRLLSQKCSLGDIAKALGRNTSAISAGKLWLEAVIGIPIGLPKPKIEPGEMPLSVNPANIS